MGRYIPGILVGTGVPGLLSPSPETILSDGVGAPGLAISEPLALLLPRARPLQRPFAGPTKFTYSKKYSSLNP